MSFDGIVEILADTPDYVVVNKPPGISVQREALIDETSVDEGAPDGDEMLCGADDGTDASGNRVAAAVGQLSTGPSLLELVAEMCGVERLLPVHRLDKMTSGVMVMAKHTEANRQLSMAFAQRQVEKYYVAIADGKPRKKQGLISGDMIRSRRGSWKLLPTRNNPAVTQFFSCSVGEGRRLYLLRPHTGKTHQLRVALKSIGAAIVGDKRYAGTAADRGYLHAYVLRFPWQGELQTFSALPKQGSLFLGDTFIEALAGFTEPWALPWPVIN